MENTKQHKRIIDLKGSVLLFLSYLATLSLVWAKRMSVIASGSYVLDYKYPWLATCFGFVAVGLWRDLNQQNRRKIRFTVYEVLIIFLWCTTSLIVFYPLSTPTLITLTVITGSVSIFSVSLFDKLYLKKLDKDEKLLYSVLFKKSTIVLVEGPSKEDMLNVLSKISTFSWKTKSIRIQLSQGAQNQWMLSFPHGILVKDYIKVLYHLSSNFSNKDDVCVVGKIKVSTSKDKETNMIVYYSNDNILNVQDSLGNTYTIESNAKLNQFEITDDILHPIQNGDGESKNESVNAIIQPMNVRDLKQFHISTKGINLNRP